MTTQSGVASRFRFWFDVVMIAVYVTAGIFTLVIDQFLDLPMMNRYVISVTLFAYSGYRVYKTMELRRETQNDEA